MAKSGGMGRAFLASVILILACEPRESSPRGGAWQPCNASKCSDDTLTCLAIYDAEADMCTPKCFQDDDCGDPPNSESDAATSARCFALSAGQLGRCVVDCESVDECPEGSLCLQDPDISPVTGKGLCAFAQP